MYTTILQQIREHMWT